MVSRDFLNAIGSLDFKKAKELSTKESHSLIKTLQEMAEADGKVSRNYFKEHLSAENLTKVTCIDKAPNSLDCTFCCDENGKSGGPIEVRKTDTGWKVHLTKAQISK